MNSDPIIEKISKTHDCQTIVGFLFLTLVQRIMKTKQIANRRRRLLRAEFASDVKFELAPVPGTVSPEAVRIRFQELQSRLVEENLSETRNPSVRGGIRQAANEAAALSWTTPYPLLVMPALFAEKAREIRLRLGKQQGVLMRSESLVKTVHDWESN